MLYSKYLAMVEKMSETEAKEILGDEKLINEKGVEVKLEVIEKDNSTDVGDVVEKAVEKAMKANIQNVRVTAEPGKPTLEKSMLFYVKQMMEHPGERWISKAATAGPTTGNANDAAGALATSVLSPTDVYDQLLGAVFDSPILSRCNTQQIQHQNLIINYRRYRPISVAVICSELGVKGENALQFMSTTLEAKTISAIYNLSNEALADQPSLANEVTTVLISDLRRYLTNAIINGVGQFGAIVGGNGTVTVQRQGGGAVVRADLANMFSSMWEPEYVSKLVWMINPRVWPSLDAEIDKNGVNLEGLRKNTLYGIEVLLSPFNPALGETGDVLLCMLDKYVVGQRQGPQIDVSEHLYFNYNAQAYRLDYRGAGGQQARELINENSQNYGWFAELDAATDSGGATDFD